MNSDRLTDKVTELGTGKVLAYTLKNGVKPLTAIQRLGELEDMKLSTCRYWNTEHEDCALSYAEIEARVIDKFVEKLKQIYRPCESMDEEAHEAYVSVCKRLDEIAEQLKKGENEE